MELRHLQALTAISDHGTFSAAAEHLNTVQSNVSAHVARLERELGVPMIDRATGRLTEEGQAVVARTRRVLAELDAMVADVAACRDEVTGAVRIGIIGTTARWLRVRVTDVATGRSKATVQIPLSLLDAGMKIGAHFAPEVEGVDMEEIMVALRAGTTGKIIDVIDEKDGEHVEIFVE